MTNKESPGDSRLAAMLAVHLVRQVLDEAYVIANAAKESGEPLSYLSMLKNLRNSSKTKLEQSAVDDATFTANTDGTTYYDDNMDHGSMIVTSTPQKSIHAMGRSTHDASCYIGQGDECYETEKEDQSTSVFINHLFELSDVERVVICDDPDCKRVKIHENSTTPNSFPSTARSTPQKSTAKIVKLNDNNSSFEILEDACENCKKNKEEDVSFYLHEDTSKNINGFDGPNEISEENQESVEEKAQDNCDTAPKIENKDGYEYAYLTMNRDYEQSEETYADLQDTKLLHEIDLGSTHKSEGDIVTKVKTLEDKVLKATSFITSSATRKNSLARRCRLQGARFFACIRGWWKRKSLGKRKLPRAPGIMRKFPLPGLKRKSNSMVDQRNLGSPSCSREEAWKFNSVSENTVKPGQWHDYTFEPEENAPK